MYRLPLKVGTPEGKRIYAEIRSSGGMVNLKIPYLEAVKKDKPKFAIKGVIKVNYPQASHKDAVEKVTKYLETLFLKELENASNNSSVGDAVNARRNKSKADTGADSSGEGQDAGSLHDSGRGDKSPKGDRQGEQDA